MKVVMNRPTVLVLFTSVDMGGRLDVLGATLLLRCSRVVVCRSFLLICSNGTSPSHP